MKALFKRNREIVNLYYRRSGMSMADIARKFHISRQRVSRILRKYKTIRTCANCYHYQQYHYCSCREGSDIVLTPNQCTDWTPVDGGNLG